MRFYFLLAAAAAISATAFAQAPPALNTLPPEAVIATVNGKDVTVADVRKMIDNSPPDFAALFRQDAKRAIQNFFLMRELAEEGEKKKLADKDPLKTKLEAARSYMLATEMVNQERNAFQVSNEAMEQFYKQNQARYSQARIKVIGIRFLPANPKGTSAEALQEAAQRELLKTQYPNLRSLDEAQKICQEIGTKLRAGADFEKLVTEYSDDQDTKPMGGDFGWVKGTSSYPEAFKKAALAIDKVGELSQPTPVQFMLYLMRLEEKKVQPLDEVREPIIQELRNAHFQSWLNALMNKYELTVKNYDFFARPGAAVSAPAAKP